tara:strand:+ start:144 stop:392 length:249 start_codon:yes stop_codon:yes gene_type:complete
MPKDKKMTYNQLLNYMGSVENKYDHAINTIGQTLADFIEFQNKKEEFMEWLKEVKYKDTQNAMQKMREEDKAKKDKPKIHRI